jgi:hypothetical protein
MRSSARIDLMSDCGMSIPQPFFSTLLELISRLKGARSVLIAGAGGGFDVFSGLPLYFLLRELGKTSIWRT